MRKPLEQVFLSLKPVKDISLPEEWKKTQFINLKHNNSYLSIISMRCACATNYRTRILIFNILLTDLVFHINTSHNYRFRHSCCPIHCRKWRLELTFVFLKLILDYTILKLGGYCAGIIISCTYLQEKINISPLFT